MPVTPLTLYGTNVQDANGNLNSAALALITSGGSPASAGVKTVVGSTTGWVELFSRGVTTPQVGQNAIPSTPTGNGWIWDDPTLQGNQIEAGAWSAQFKLEVSSAGLTFNGDITTRAFIYHGDTGASSMIGQITLLNQSLINTPTLFSLAAVTLAAAIFNSSPIGGPGDFLYFDAWFRIAQNTGGGSTGIIMTEYTGTSGSTNMEWVTPGYDASSLPGDITPDSATGSDAVALGVVQAPETDSASGADAVTNESPVSLSDSAIGGEALGIDILEVLTDLAASSEGYQGAGVNTLSLYGTGTLDSPGTLTTASQIVTATGGSPAATGKKTTIGTFLGYGELWSQGTATTWAQGGALGAQSGNGWILDTATLAGQAFISGPWSASYQMKTTAGTITADIIARVSIFHSGSSTYSTVGTITLLAQTITTVSATYTLPATLLAAAGLAASGDYVYLDLQLNITASSGTGGGTQVQLTVYTGTSGNSLNAVVAPGYAANADLGFGLYDLAAGADALSLGTQQIAPSDAATGADTQTGLTVSFEAGPDTGAGSETLVAAQQISVPDTGAGSETLAPTATLTLLDRDYADAVALDILYNLQRNGLDTHSEINTGAGGLWVNWRYGQPATQFNFNGTGLPDAYPLPIPPNTTTVRHDRLTDLRLVQNLWRYKAKWPSDHQFDTFLATYTAILKDDFPTYTEARGWVYDVMMEIYNATVAAGVTDSWFSTAAQGLATSYANNYNSTVGTIFSVSSTYPLGYYRVDWVVEEACALIQAGTTFSNATWVTIGYNVLSFVWTYAYMSATQTLPFQLYNVLNSDGSVNTAELFLTAVGGNQTKTDFVAQVVISLLHAYALTSDATLLAKAQALLYPMQQNPNSLGFWDTTHTGYFYYITYSGTGPTTPGLASINSGKKEVGRQIQMLDAFRLANQYTSDQYADMEAAMLQVMCYKAYTPAYHGVVYEVSNDWSPWPNAGSSSGVEDWATSEAMGIALNGLLAPTVATSPYVQPETFAPLATFPATDAGAGADGAPTFGAPITFGAADPAAGDENTPTVSAIFEAGPDAAGGGDALASVATFPATDAGAGADGAPVVGATFEAGPDAGAGAEGLAFGVITPTNDDSAAGSDAGAPTVSATLAPGPDAGAGAEGLSALATLAPGPDASAGSESVQINSGGAILLALGDLAAGAETFTLGPITPSLPNTGAGADALQVTIPFALPGDTGNGADALSTQATLAVTDTGAGADGAPMTLVSPPVSDIASGAEIVTAAITLPLTEAALGGEGLLTTVSLVASDTASGAETPLVTAIITVSDAGSGQELQVNVVQLVLLADAGRGAETLVAPQLLYTAVTFIVDDLDLVFVVED